MLCLFQVVSAEDIKDRLAEIDVFGGEPRRDSLDMFNPGIYEWRTGISISPGSTSNQQEETLRIQQAQLYAGQQPRTYNQQHYQQPGQREPERPPRDEEQQSHQQKSQQQRQQQSDGAAPVAPPRRRESKQKTANQDQVNCLTIQGWALYLYCVCDIFDMMQFSRRSHS